MPTATPAIRFPLPPVQNVLKIVLRGFVDRLLEEVWNNILHIKWTGGAPSFSDLEGLAQHISSLWGSFMAPEVPNPTSLEEVDVTDLSSATSASAQYPASVLGTRGDDGIPANACVLVSYPLLRRYQGGHPRTYLMAGGNADITGTTEWHTAFQAEVLSHWHNFLNAILATGLPDTTLQNFCSVSYVNKATGTPPHFYRAVPLTDNLDLSKMFVQLGIASQRRRIGRGGETEKAPKMGAARMTIARANELLGAQP